MRRIAVIVVSLVAICGLVAVVAAHASTPRPPLRRPPNRRAATRRQPPTPVCSPRRSTASGSRCWPVKRRRTSGNVVISPLSIHDVLSMILNGARGARRPRCGARSASRG